MKINLIDTNTPLLMHDIFFLWSSSIYSIIVCFDVGLTKGLFQQTNKQIKINAAEQSMSCKLWVIVIDAM